MEPVQSLHGVLVAVANIIWDSASLHEQLTPHKRALDAGIQHRLTELGNALANLKLHLKDLTS